MMEKLFAPHPAKTPKRQERPGFLLSLARAQLDTRFPTRPTLWKALQPTNIAAGWRQVHPGPLEVYLSKPLVDLSCSNKTPQAKAVTNLFLTILDVENLRLRPW